MNLATLLLTKDQNLVRPMRAALEAHSIGVEVCIGPNAGAEILKNEHFDSVFIDCDDIQGGVQLLRDIRNMPAIGAPSPLLWLIRPRPLRRLFRWGQTL